MSMKINNRVLGIDSKDVMKCEDLEVLNEWRMNIAMQRSDVLFNNSVTREADLPSGEKKKMLFLRRFESIIFRRITEIKERTRMERKEAQALTSEAKGIGSRNMSSWLISLSLQYNQSRD